MKTLLAAGLMAAILTVSASADLSPTAPLAKWSKAHAVVRGCASQFGEYLRGYCTGTVWAVLELAPLICPPHGVTRGHAVRIVAEYIESRPHRMHDHFVDVVIAALQTAWPCRDEEP